MLNSAFITTSRFSALLRCYIFLTCLSSTLMLLLVTLSLPIQPQGISPMWNSGLHPELDVLRPEDLTGRTRQLKPSDDQVPPAHKPIGPGTLRDIREELFYHGGLSTVMLDGVSRSEPAVYNPYPDYNGEAWTSSGKGMFHACEGPRGRTLNRRNHDNMVLAYPGVITGIPSLVTVDWNKVKWGMLQVQCLQYNLYRYTATDKRPINNILPLRLMTTLSSNKGNRRSLCNKKRAALLLYSGREYKVLLTYVKGNKILLYNKDSNSNAQHLKKSRFNYLWQLEMDSCLTGHFYHLLERACNGASGFAKKQPRKYLWEYNAYFYIPGAQDTWDTFIRTINQSMAGKPIIWGPAPPPSNLWMQIPLGPTLPVPRPEDNNYTWGTGKDMDLLTFLPFFNPTKTNWVFSNILWNFLAGLLLKAIHNTQTTKGIAIISKITTPMFILWHGLKAVHVPHPVYVDRKGSNSVWNWDHKFNHIYSAAEDLYCRWLGYEADKNQYTDGSIHQDPQGRNLFNSGDLREDIYGPLCFPPMFLHPVKNAAVKKGPDMAVPV
ncbi:hypothetical protein BDV11DRAFT_208365 [Aspergillus similis]